MVRVRLLALVFLLSGFSFGQTLIYTRTVKGNLFLPPGQGAQNSKMRFQLKYCQGQAGRVPVNPGSPPGPTGLIVSEPFDVTVLSDGSWQTQVYGNDQIVCGTDLSGPSRWLIQPIFNGQAGTGVEYQIQSCGAALPCQPFSPDTAPSCGAPNPNPPPPTFVTDCAIQSGVNPDQPDTTVTINATMAVPNAINFGSVLLPPANGKVINFLLNGNQAGAYLPGNGNASTCLSGTGTYVLCGGGGGGSGVTGATVGGGLVLNGTTLGLIRTCTANQYLSWNGTSWVCTTLSGGGGGNFPVTAQYDLFASNGGGGAQVSGILGGSGFLKGQVLLATGDVTSAPAPFPLAPNASMEYFPSGGYGAGGANGLAAFFSHSGVSGANGNGGVALAGGNSSGANYKIYLDCEVAGCDFKVPPTYNGAAIGGGGGGGLPTIPAPNLFASNGSGSAVDSGVLGQAGFLRAYVLEATGTGNASPFTVPNGSIEYFPTGGYGAGGGNGVALHVSHSGSATGFGGIAFAGGNTSGVDQLYLDCEGPPVVPALGCDFKVPITVNGAAVGGGGSPGVSSINGATGAFTFTGPGVTCGSPSTTCTFTGGGGGGSGTVGAGTGGFFTWYSATGTTVASNPHLDDSVTTATTITSQETIAAPGLNVTGTGGISMTGVGGNLPTPAAGQGGIGIGPGNVPQYYSNGGAWTAIGAGGGSGTVSSGTSGQFAVYNGTTSVGSTPDLVDVAGTSITSNVPLTMAGTNAITLGSGGINCSVQTTPTLGTGVLGCIGGGYPALAFNGSGGVIRAITATSVNGTWLGSNQVNWNNTTPAAPANGRNIVFANSGVNVTAALVGDGSSNCLSGLGTYVACGTSGGGGGVGAGTIGQLAGYSTASTVTGADSFYSAGSTPPSLPFLSGGFAINSGGIPVINVGGFAWNRLDTINSIGTQIINTQNVSFLNNGQTGNPAPTLPANALGLNWAISTNIGTPGSVASWTYALPFLQGDGTATHCLIGTGVFAACPGGGGSGTVSSGTVGQFAFYSATGNTVVGNTHLDDGQTASGQITSSEPFLTQTAFGSITLDPNVSTITISDSVSSPLLTVDGNGGISILPTLSTQNIDLSSQGRVDGNGPSTPPDPGYGAFGFLSGGVPAISTNGGPFVAIGTGGGGSGTVGTGTVGQFALYSGANAVAGSPSLTYGTSPVAGAQTNAIISTQPIALPTTQGIMCTGLSASINVGSNANPGMFGCTGSGTPAIQYTGSGGALRAITTTSVNGANPFGSNLVNWSGSVANPPVCSAATPTNGRCLSYVANGSSISSFLVGDGTTNCLSGQGNYVPCSGASPTVTCMLASDLLTFTARTNVCTLNLPAGAAKQWIVSCNLIWNMQTGGSGATTITGRLNLNNAPTAASYFTAETWAGGGPTFGNVNVLAQTGDTIFETTATNNTDLTIWSYVFRGTIMAPAAGETAIFSMQSSNGTGAVRLGTSCIAN